MQLKFYAKPEHVVHFPGPRQSGQIHNYVGRQFVLPDPARAMSNGRRVAGQHRALREAFVIDSDAPEAVDLARSAQHGGLWPADKATAQAIGVQFTKLAYDANTFEWLPDTTPDAEPEASAVAPETSAPAPLPESPLVGAPSADSSSPSTSTTESE